MLVSKNAKICVSPNAKPKICFTPNANPQHKSVEHRLHWVPLVTEREPSLQLSMGYRVSLCSCRFIVDAPILITIATVYRSCGYV